MKLGFVLEPEINNSFYRVVFPMRALADRGHTVPWPDQMSQDIPMRELLSCDLVHCFRREDRIADLETLAKRGVAISVDNDDDLGMTDMIGGVASFQGRVFNNKRAARSATQARLADLVTTPSPVIAEKYRTARARNVVVIENYLDPNMHCFGHSSKHDGVTVGWVAAAEHGADVAQMRIAETVARLLDAHADLRVLTFGVKLDLRSERYQHSSGVPHMDLFKALSDIDIGIAPITDSPFNRARSDVKLKEYGGGRMAWLASPVGPYLGLGPKQGGMLVRDDEWFDAIDRLIRNPLRRRRLARRALRWAKGQTIDRHAASWEAEFERAIELAAERRTGARGATVAGYS